jgi:protein arginine kinase activator
MLCNECGKNVANIHLTRIINGQKIEENLCETCAKKYKGLNYPFTLQNIMSGFLTDHQKPESQSSLSCPECHMTYDDFRKYGKFGCSHCYHTFKDRLAPLIRNIHGHENHIGKTPGNIVDGIKIDGKLDQLRDQLRKAIEMEEYEKAAEIRDKIKDIETAKGVG